MARKYFRFGAVAALLVTLAPMGFVAPVVGVNQASAAQSVTSLVDMLNSYRAQHGLSRVRIDRTLMSVAQRQAEAMQSARVLSHDVAGGFSQRLDAAGIVNTRAAENVSMGYSSADRAFAGWMNSPHHNANMLLSDATRVGVAVAQGPNGIYWAMDLSSD